MKNKLLIAIVLLTALAVGCERDLEPDSEAQTTSIPEVIDYTPGIYIFGLGNGDINKTIPDTLGVLVDSVYGFDDGFGGVTGKDTTYLLKSDVASWPDTSAAGAKNLSVEKYNSFVYKSRLTITVLILAPNTNPGPTDIAGKYGRNTTSGFEITISKLSDGTYYIENLGGAGVTPYPFVLKNFKSSNGSDSLAFALQGNECGGGTVLASPDAPAGLKASDYSTYPPKITSYSPLTLQWRIYTFQEAKGSSVQPGDGLSYCTWGTPVRVFVKK